MLKIFIVCMLSTANAQDLIELKHDSCGVLSRSIIQAYRNTPASDLKYWIQQYFKVCNSPVEESLVHQPKLIIRSLQ